MTIAPDPNSVTTDDSDDGFEKAFEEFAADKVPHSDEPPEPAASEGNDPEDEAPAPAPAATEVDTADAVTSGDADAAGGGQSLAAPAPDLWDNAPPELRSHMEQVLRERDQALHRAQSDSIRVAALSRKLNQLSAPPPEAPAQGEEAKAALDGKVKQLREDYGEIAEPLIELIETQKKELDHVRTSLSGLNDAQRSQHVAVEVAALESRHADWREVAQSPDFSGWLQYQPDNIQRLATSWDARETSVALTLYKAERAEAQRQYSQGYESSAPVAANVAADARRSQQLDGGRDVRSRPAPAASGPPEDFDAAFEYFERKRAAKARAATSRR